MRPEGTRNANASLLAERSRTDLSRFKIEPLRFYNSYVTNNCAKHKSAEYKSAKYVMMKGGVS
jgi:hypothetical protein